MNINTGQILSGLVVVCSVIVTSSSQLGDLGLDPASVKSIVAAAALIMGISGALLTKLQSTKNQVQTAVDNRNEPAVQEQLVNAVASYRGVDNISTNNQASDTLKRMSVDANVPKVTNGSYK